MLRIINSEIAYAGKLFNVEVLTMPSANGGTRRREVVRHPGAVVVIPVLEGGGIVMIRNFRIAVNESLWELTAGKLERGEAPIDAAARELEEETGYRAGRIEPLGCFYTSPGFADELMHAFTARELVHVGQRLEPDEEIEVRLVPREEMMRMIEAGEIRDGKTIAAALMWAMRTARKQ